MSYVYLFGALFCLCLGHCVRLFRWELFVAVYEKPNRKSLLQSLALGFILNYFLPYKLGEILRAWLSGRKMKSGKALGFSTVIVDRYLDIICVGLIFLGFYVCGLGGETTAQSAIFYTALAVIFVVLLYVANRFSGIVKRLVKVVAGIFNNHIEEGILQFSWALIWNFKDIFHKLNKKKLILYTISMWGLYMVSYAAFAFFLRSLGNEVSMVDIFMLLFTQNGIKASTAGLSMIVSGSYVSSRFLMVYYTLIPLVGLFAIATFEKESANDDSEEGMYLNLIPHLDPEERLKFLEKYFSDVNRAYVNNYIRINQDISIIRDYSAGSNATTMLCTDGKQVFFRKYAFGEDGDKLNDQIMWIEENRDNLPLPEIIKKEYDKISCYYDMPYINGSSSMFEYVHSMPLDNSWELLKTVLGRLENSVYKVNIRKADSISICRYIGEKVTANLERLQSSRQIKALLPYETIIINGREYKNLGYYSPLFEERFLTEVFKNNEYALIHGDLTIENIICIRDDRGYDDFYIIDPNTGNIHESPDLDYAKLLQSVHGGYEFLMSVKDVKIDGNRLRFLFTKSSIYDELHERLKNYMLENFGYERTKSIYMHEVIHWLRLMPYKLAKNDKKAVVFYSGLLMVLEDVAAMFVEDVLKGERRDEQRIFGNI